MAVFCFSAFLASVSGREYLVLDQDRVLAEVPLIGQINQKLYGYLADIQAKVDSYDNRLRKLSPMKCLRV